jgi:two-component system chemotaxis response regulator CheY
MTHKITTLIAEDVELMRRLLRISLLSMNCEILAELPDGESVMEAVKKDRPDVVFLDINLPRMNGLDVLQQLKTYDPEQFVVMVSAHNTTDNIKLSIERGADGFLVKPFTNLKISEMLENYREKHRHKSA